MAIIVRSGSLEIVDRTRAIRWWIDAQIEKGATDDEIAAGLPVAVAVISGRLSLEEVRARMEARP